MREWYTQDRVCEVLHRANRFGINAFNWVNVERSPEDLARFQSEGGKMHLIIQVMARDDAATLVKNLKPLALQRRGEDGVDGRERRRGDPVRGRQRVVGPVGRRLADLPLLVGDCHRCRRGDGPSHR